MYLSSKLITKMLFFTTFIKMFIRNPVSCMYATVKVTHFNK